MRVMTITMRDHERHSRSLIKSIVTQHTTCEQDNAIWEQYVASKSQKSRLNEINLAEKLFLVTTCIMCGLMSGYSIYHSRIFNLSLADIQSNTLDDR